MRLRFSTYAALVMGLVLVLLLSAAVLLGREPGPSDRTVLTLRLWDPQIGAAYRKSLDAFTAANPDIEVRIDTVAYAGYFDSLRADVAGHSADDVFWLNSSYLAPYADSGRLLPIEADPDWEPSVVGQFTRGGTLWGVPQLTDAGIALYYNRDLLAAAGVGPDDLADLRWGTDADTLRPLLARLTVDTVGRSAADPGFDAGRTRTWGYNAANDLQAINLNYLASAGGRLVTEDAFTFDSPAGRTAFGYLVALINTDRVAPPASATNNNGDFSRNRRVGRLRLGYRPDARRPARPGQRHQRHRRRRQRRDRPSRAGTTAAGLARQRRGQRVSGGRRGGHPGGAVRPARLPAVLGRARRRRRAVLRCVGRPARRGARRGGRAGRIGRHQAVFRRDVSRPAAGGYRAGPSAGGYSAITATQTSATIASATASLRPGRAVLAEIWPMPPRAVIASPISSARRSAAVIAATSMSTSSNRKRRHRIRRMGSTVRGRSLRAA
jgi:hypothetical protein